MSDIQYPPTAAVRDSVTEQPKPASPMSLSKTENDKQSPQRLRGGCVPCPVSLFDLYIFTRYKTDIWLRMEAFVSVFPSRVVS